MFSIRIRSDGGDGPFFDARVFRAMNDFTDELEEEAADWALAHVKATYHREFKNPTGRYESHVRTHRVQGGMEVWDGGQAGPVYGPWLEGVGSRNRTTRFKGYHAFRKAAIALDQRAGRIGHRVLARFIHRMQ